VCCCHLQNALLIAASTTPFSQAATQAATARTQLAAAGALMPVSNSSTFPIWYNHQTFGIMWTVTLSFSCFALTVSMLLLGYMLSIPEEGMYDWATEKAEHGYLGHPAVLTIAGTLMFILSVNYSAAVYYGFWAVVPVMAISFMAIIAMIVGQGKFSYSKPRSDREAATQNTEFDATAAGSSAARAATADDNLLADTIFTGGADQPRNQNQHMSLIKRLTAQLASKPSDVISPGVSTELSQSLNMSRSGGDNSTTLADNAGGQLPDGNLIRTGTMVSFAPSQHGSQSNGGSDNLSLRRSSEAYNPFSIGSIEGPLQQQQQHQQPPLLSFNSGWQPPPRSSKQCNDALT
jgi:hypothetical protein